MSRRMVQSDALEEVQVRFGEGVPLQLLEQHVMSEIDTQISTGGNSPAGVLEFLLVHVDRDISAYEVLKPTGVVEMQMAQDYGLDVFDIVSSGFDGRWELLALRVFGPWEHVCEGSWPMLEGVSWNG